MIIRHGETVENVKEIIMGQLLSGNLSEKGKEQARKVAERLSKEKIDFIYSSDLARASDTAKEIAKHHPGTDMVLTKEARECDFGEFQGKSMEEIGLEKFLKFYRSLDFSPIGGENAENIFNRAERFLENIIEKHHDDTVLVVTHEVFKKVLISVIINKNHEYVNALGKLGNASLSILEIDSDRNHRIHVIGCKKHLD